MDEPEPLQQIDRTYVRYRGRKLSYFSGCDYFRLASHPAVLKALQQGLQKFGLNVAASRLTTGNHELYLTLEKELERFFDVDDALLVGSGYATSLMVAQALAGSFSHVLIDERAHPALQDAALAMNCPIIQFKHRDSIDFARVLNRIGGGVRPIAFTDGMFAHDGSVAPLQSYLKQLPPDGFILVDDAHGAGVLGKTGKGTPEFEGVGRRRLIQCITLSKAFGTYGGAVLGTRALRKSILSRSRMFIGSTPLPLPLANAALAAIHLLRNDRSLRRQLVDNAAYVKDALRQEGIEFAAGQGPIISLPGLTSRQMALLKRRLLAANIYPPLLKYPGGPGDGCYRFVISSEHSRTQLNRMLKALIQPATSQ